MKGVFLSIAITVFILQLLVAQEATTPPPAFKRHMVGVNYSNDITSQINNLNISEPYKAEVRYGFAAALLYQYRATKWLSVETGIEINNTTYYLDDPNSDIMTAWNGESFDPAISSRIDYGWRTTRIGVPINLRGYYHKEKWSLYGMAGVVLTTDYLHKTIYEISEWTFTDNLVGQEKFKDLFGVGVSAGIGAEYEVTKTLVLRMEPRFRVYDIIKPNRRTAYNSSKEIIERDWAVGLNLGIYYGFGKK